MRVLVIDRDEATRKLLVKMLSEFYEGDLRTYGNPAEAIFDVEEGVSTPDVLFIDTDLLQDNPGEEECSAPEGIRIASQIQELYPRTQVIFLSDREDRYLDVYEVDHVWHLHKPPSQEKLKRAWSRALEHMQIRERETFVFEFNRKTHIIPCDDILFFEKNRRRVLIHLQGESKPLVFYSSMDELLSRLNEDFFRCHESYVVNLSHVKSHSRGSFLVGSSKVPISRRYVHEAEKRMGR